VKKNKLLIANYLLLIVGCFIFTGCIPKKTTVPPAEKATPTPAKPLEESILERPFVSLVPTSDGHWVNLEVKNIKSGTKSVDYELIYFAGETRNKIERGVAGSIELKGDSSFQRKILFGSESCTTGKCKYKFDENVSEGMLTLKLRSDSGSQKFESAFRLQKGIEGKEGLSTGDGNFKFVSSNLHPNSYFLSISTFGLPAETAGKATLPPYGIFPSIATKGTVSFKTTDQSAKILLWDNGKWQELTGLFSEGWISASVSKTGIFVLVK